MKKCGFEKIKGVESLYRYRPTGKYYARFVVNGKEVRRSIGTTDRDLAKRQLAQPQSQAATVDPCASKITLARLCDRYLATVRYQASKTMPTRRTLLLSLGIFFRRSSLATINDQVRYRSV